MKKYILIVSLICAAAIGGYMLRGTTDTVSVPEDSNSDSSNTRMEELERQQSKIDKLSDLEEEKEEFQDGTLLLEEKVLEEKKDKVLELGIPIYEGGSPLKIYCGMRYPISTEAECWQIIEENTIK